MSLLASPESRKLGKEWITKQMYHNKDRVYQHFGFQPMHQSNDFVFDVQAKFGETGYNLEYLKQMYCPSSLEEFVEFYRHTVQSAVIYYDPTIPLASILLIS